MMTLNFGTFPKVIIQDRVAFTPEVRMEVINPLAKQQEAKDLIPLTTKSGKIMSVHPEIINDEQQESSQPNLKGKSCNVISLTVNDDITTMASLSSSEEDKFAFIAQLATSQLVGTRSGKSYLRQYDQTHDETQQLMTSGTAAPILTLALPQDKQKQKEVCFDKSLKKNPYQGLNTLLLL